MADVDPVLFVWWISSRNGICPWKGVFHSCGGCRNFSGLLVDLLVLLRFPVVRVGCFWQGGCLLVLFGGVESDLRMRGFPVVLVLPGVREGDFIGGD